MFAPTGSVPREGTWQVFLDTVHASYLSRRDLAPLPASEDPADAGVRAMQRGRRSAWMHARHVMGLSMFESVRLSQRLADTFAEWSRLDHPRVGDLMERLRRTEDEARRPEPVTLRTAFVERFAVLSGQDTPGETWEVALRAYQEVERRFGTVRLRRA